MTTLITGGAGFIGSQLAARLIHLGQPIIILDNFDDYYDPAIKRANVAALKGAAEIIEGDIRDTQLLEQVFQQHRITRVAHLGGLAGVRNSIENGPLYADINTRGSVNMLDISRKYDVEIFMQASTSSVYGETPNIPFREADAPDQPLAAYPASKRAAELFGYSYHHLFGLNVTALRFFNVYGPAGRPDMMPLKVIDALLRQEAIPIFGEGKLLRDWTYIDDVLDGVIAALERPLGYRVINMGCGAPVSLTDFIHIYEELTGRTAITKPVPTPASEPPITYCDNTLARQLLGFTPKVTLPEGLARTWAWYRESRGI